MSALARHFENQILFVKAIVLFTDCLSLLAHTFQIFKSRSKNMICWGNLSIRSCLLMRLFFLLVVWIIWFTFFRFYESRSMLDHDLSKQIEFLISFVMRLTDCLSFCALMCSFDRFWMIKMLIVSLVREKKVRTY